MKPKKSNLDLIRESLIREYQNNKKIRQAFQRLANGVVICVN